MSRVSPFTRLRYAAFGLFSRHYGAKSRALAEREAWMKSGCNPDRMGRSASYIAATNSVYVPVPKAANTAIKTMLAERPPEDPMAVHAMDPATRPVIFNVGITPGDLARGLYPAFTVVRHPISRFWSAYHRWIVDEELSPLRTIVAPALDLKATDEITPDQVLTYVEGADTAECEEHLQPQWARTAIDWIDYAHIGHFEALEETVEALIEKRLVPEGSKERLGHLNPSSRGERPVESSPHDARLRKVYERDFDLFGYGGET